MPKCLAKNVGWAIFAKKFLLGKFLPNVGGGQKLPLVPKILVGEILAKNVGGAKNYP